MRPCIMRRKPTPVRKWCVRQRKLSALMSISLRKQRNSACGRRDSSNGWSRNISRAPITRPNMSAELLPKISKLSHGRMEQTCPPRSPALCVCAMRAHLIAMFSRQDSLNSRSVKKDRRNKGVAFAPKMNQQKQVEVDMKRFD
ncbi:hypothetical protein OUZ56_031493 [Daphnia magna]|uniref:Uncharacterized protein n=1 Tax=Daphnia magna TaxID=35525 RepID=A0ABQ9ZUE3_9CRUS|nr:hypothetical protein OUZ56_031493 [Daphnia magna]